MEKDLTNKKEKNETDNQTTEANQENKGNIKFQTIIIKNSRIIKYGIIQRNKRKYNKKIKRKSNRYLK